MKLSYFVFCDKIMVFVFMILCSSLCHSGTYNNQTGLIMESECQECVPGFYCQQSGLENVEGLCFAG